MLHIMSSWFLVLLFICISNVDVMHLMWKCLYFLLFLVYAKYNWSDLMLDSGVTDTMLIMYVK